MTYHTSKKLWFDPMLYKKIELIAKRIKKNKQDVLILFAGKTGSGKSNLAAGCGFALAEETGREFSVDNVFFDPDDMLKYATTHEKQIIWWDEAAIAGMASDWQSKIQKKLVKLFFMARKKQHIYLICIPQFEKLNEVIINKANCLMRTYEEGGLIAGKFQYFTENRKKNLYDTWKKTKYMKFPKFKAFRGNFRQYLPKCINEDAYEAKKDLAIAAIGEEKKSARMIKLENQNNMLKEALVKLEMYNKDKAKVTNIPASTIKTWKSRINTENSDESGLITPISLRK